jgi:hypothetical protein
MKGGDGMSKNNKKKSGYQVDDVFAQDDEQSVLTGLISDATSANLSNANVSESKGRGNQGFASMSKEKQREIASKGGKAAHQQGTAHEWTSSEAAAAGRRGGQSKATAVIDES